MTPQELIESYKRGRSEMAKKIRDMRTIIRRNDSRDRTKWTIMNENTWVRRLVYTPVGYGIIKPPVKPTVNNLACLAEVYTLYGRAPLPWERDPHWVNPLDTEYYSMCGHEDMIYDQREAAREYAEELINAVDWLLEQEERQELIRDTTREHFDVEMFGTIY